MTTAEEKQAIEQFRDILRRCGDMCLLKRGKDRFYGMAELSDEGVLNVMNAVAVALTEEEVEALQSLIEPKGNA